MKNLIIFLLLSTIQFSAYAEWFNANHPDTSNIEVFGNRGDTLFTYDYSKIIYKSNNLGVEWKTINSNGMIYLNHF